MSITTHLSRVASAVQVCTYQGLAKGAIGRFQDGQKRGAPWTNTAGGGGKYAPPENLKYFVTKC